LVFVSAAGHYFRIWTDSIWKSTCMAQTNILTDSTRKRHKYEDFVQNLKNQKF
jgi:hypothetical protein